MSVKTYGCQRKANREPLKPINADPFDQLVRNVKPEKNGLLAYGRHNISTSSSSSCSSGSDILFKSLPLDEYDDDPFLRNTLIPLDNVKKSKKKKEVVTRVDSPPSPRVEPRLPPSPADCLIDWSEIDAFELVIEKKKKQPPLRRILSRPLRPVRRDTPEPGVAGDDRPMYSTPKDDETSGLNPILTFPDNDTPISTISSLSGSKSWPIHSEKGSDEQLSRGIERGTRTRLEPVKGVSGVHPGNGDSPSVCNFAHVNLAKGPGVLHGSSKYVHLDLVEGSSVLHRDNSVTKSQSQRSRTRHLDSETGPSELHVGVGRPASLATKSNTVEMKPCVVVLTPLRLEGKSCSVSSKLQGNSPRSYESQHLDSVSGASEAGGYAYPATKNCSVVLTPLRSDRKSCSKRKSMYGRKVIPLEQTGATHKLQVLKLCQQVAPLSFKTILPQKVLSRMEKIGEGTYGEVFRSGSRVLKIVPIEGNFEVNCEAQKTFRDVLSEIIISRELSELAKHKEFMSTNYIRLDRVCCARGKYPKKLLQEWKRYARNKESLNDDPDKFPSSQLYILFEFADGGIDLESYQFESAEQAKSAVVQIACSLAVAEEALEFEHRDLHWSNVLVCPTQLPTVDYVLGGVSLSVPSCGVAVSIIDFTLSRLAKDGCAIYTDLSEDPTFFEGNGDYQFEVYRKMKRLNGNDWSRYETGSNVLWLHYLLRKLCEEKRYPQMRHPALHQMRKWRDSVLKYDSGADFVQSILPGVASL